jgi:hypothetical protein
MRASCGRVTFLAGCCSFPQLTEFSRCKCLSATPCTPEPSPFARFRIRGIHFFWVLAILLRRSPAAQSATLSPKGRSLLRFLLYAKCDARIDNVSSPDGPKKSSAASTHLVRYIWFLDVPVRHVWSKVVVGHYADCASPLDLARQTRAFRSHRVPRSAISAPAQHRTEHGDTHGPPRPIIA